MALQNQEQDYTIDGMTYTAYVAWDDAGEDQLPGVIVSHAFGGRSEFDNKVADKLAALGYVGVAIDLYGKGVRGSNREESVALMKPLKDDRGMLQLRLLANVDFVRSLKQVNAEKIAAIGYCFGGMCVLDIARTGADIKGVVSFHGLLNSSERLKPVAIAAKVLILHGWDDPMATPDAVLAVSKELTRAGADWQLHAYGHTVHGYTNPKMTTPGQPTVYDADADRRSWQSTVNFLDEIFE